ncbi:hypothetical protein [Rhizobium tumorigenes]|uniref:hypothetical protein n=1 Tax=Rhizobium tumorigenes TaxID=2041385 RepID=UPI00241D8917|nr:hypothetical protein [Rhizobium tumorigenes]WFS02793.1 hypothetical protein PR016_09400 [Rhizobium tumorigenes]
MTNSQTSSEPRSARLARERLEAALFSGVPQRPWSRATPPWTGWRVFAVDIHDAVDGLARAVVFVELITDSKQTRIFEFMVDEAGVRRSPRFDAFLHACGMVERVDDTREIEGRYFAARGEGETATDFGALALALN